jgi:hypothetical protein
MVTGLQYRHYIASHEWRSNPARLTELTAADGHCRLCFTCTSAGARLEVHHATYVRLGCEDHGDLIALCSECHREVESFLRRRRYANRGVVRNDVLQLRDVRRPLVDPTR